MSDASKCRRIEIYCAPEEVERLVREFEACTLPRVKWTHYAHLTVALWYLSRHSKDDATHLIRESIQRYNRDCGGVTTKDNGYHETTTLFYVWVVSKYLSGAEPGASVVRLANGLISACVAKASLCNTTAATG